MNKKRYIVIGENDEPLKNEDGTFVYEEIEEATIDDKKPEEKQPEDITEEKIKSLIDECIKSRENEANISQPIIKEEKTSDNIKKDYGVFIPNIERNK